MKEYRFKITSREYSKAIQKRLFELGYGWGGNRDKAILHTDKPVIVTHIHGMIGYGSDNGKLKYNILDDLYSTFEYKLKHGPESNISDLDVHELREGVLWIGGTRYKVNDLKELIKQYDYHLDNK